MFPMAHMGLPLLPFLASGRFPRWAPIIALGGLIPDLIDKPLGHLIMSENNGRIFAHTLLFALILFGTGLLWSKAMPLAYGVIFHHLLDFVYNEPDPTLWPFLGPFATTDFEYITWIDHLFQPLNLIGEVAGIALLVWWLIKWSNARGRASKTIYN